MNPGVFEKFLNKIGYVKSVTGRYHEDDIYKALLKAGTKYYKDPVAAYEEHPWVYSAVWAVANAAAMLPTKIFKLDEEGHKIEVPKHWLLDLLRNPNPYYSGYDLIEGSFTYLELVGDAYWEIVKNEKGEISAFYLLRSDRVEVVGDEKRLVKGYIYTPNITRYALQPEDVIHFKYFSPTSELNGQGSIRAATSALEADYLGNEYFKDFFRRGAELSFAVKVPQRMSQESYDRLHGAMKSKHQGTGKQKGILILEEGADYIPTGTEPKDSGEAETSARGRRSVAGTVGVPPIKLQLLEGSSYANARFQDVGFWKNTMLPRLKKFYAKITLDCLRVTGGLEWIDPDMFKQLMNIDEFRNEADAYKNLVDAGILKPNEARDRLDFGAEPEGDTLMVSPNRVPLKDLVNLEEEEEEFEEQS